MITFDNEISVKELRQMLKRANDTDRVCIRQCEGTDFPPFVSIEDASECMRMDAEGFAKLTL